MIKAIIGLGNPGPQFFNTRHNVGFMVLDALADKYRASWRTADNLEVTSVTIADRQLLLIKPQTFMNNSGRVIPFLTKKGIKPEEILVVHDELELPVGKVSVKLSGSARGHNGLRSLIEACGDAFKRIRVGIGRPEDRAQVPDYVLERFSEQSQQVDAIITQAIDTLELFISKESQS